MMEPWTSSGKSGLYFSWTFMATGKKMVRL